MNKKEIQKRVLQNGKPLGVNKFTWDESTKTFSSDENNLVIDFSGIDYCTFNTGSYCTFNTGYGCTFKTSYGCTFKTSFGCVFNTGSYCTFNTGYGCTFKTSYGCTFKTSFGCVFDTGSGCTFNTGDGCTFKTGSGCMFKTGLDCTFDTDDGCTFNTGYGCTFKTSFGCTFKTGSSCTFKTSYGCTFNAGPYCMFNTSSVCTFDTGYNCTFDTGSYCMFKTSYGCTFNAGEKCVVVRSDVFQTIQLKPNVTTKLMPCRISGYLERNVDGKFYRKVNGKKIWSVIFDSILSDVISCKKTKDATIWKVINHGEKDPSFIIETTDFSAHGDTINNAKEALLYKFSERDLSEYENMALDTVLTFKESLQMYGSITGACSSGMRCFVEQESIKKKDRSVKEIIKLTENQYNHQALVNFFNKKEI